MAPMTLMAAAITATSNAVDADASAQAATHNLTASTPEGWTGTAAAAEAAKRDALALDVSAASALTGTAVTACENYQIWIQTNG